MRPLEILLILTPIPYFIWPLLSREKRPIWSALSPLFGLLLIPIHLLTERYRWQMVPVYVVIVLLSLIALWQWQMGATRPIKRTLSLIGAVLGLLLVLLTAVLPTALPVPKLVKSSGPYATSTTTYYWVDENREEMFGPKPGGPRELMVQIWYPAEADESAEPVPWNTDIDTVGPALAAFLDFPPFFLNHLKLAKTRSVADAPLLTSQEHFPVLIFSHGLGGVRMQNTFQMEELASQGFVVASIDHTYGGSITVFPDGRVALFDTAVIEGDSEAAGNRLIHIWAEDGRFVADQLEALNADDPKDIFTNHLSLAQIGYFGHSTGGGTAFLFCQIDPRCGVGVALDGWLSPLSAEIAAQPMTKPFLFLKAENWSTAENTAAITAADEARQAPGSVIVLPGTQHYNFTDIPLLTPLTPQLGITGPANGRETLNTINDDTLSFFNEYLETE